MKFATPSRVGVVEVAALLDVRVLVDDPRLERREVGGDVGREVVGEVVLERCRPAPSSASQAAVLHVAMTRWTEVK